MNREQSEKQRIFILGMPKTGLSTIMGALQSKGYKVCSSPNRIYGRNIAELKASFRKKVKQELYTKYDVFLDLPWQLEYKWLFQNFPNSYFILTVRETESWLKSYMLQFSGSHQALHYWAFGDAVFEARSEEIKVFYESFNKEVKQFFEGKNKFTVLNMPDQLTWDSLGLAIGEDLGSGALPLRNSKSNRKTIAWWVRRKPRAFIGHVIRFLKRSL